MQPTPLQRIPNWILRYASQFSKSRIMLSTYIHAVMNSLESDRRPGENAYYDAKTLEAPLDCCSSHVLWKDHHRPR